MPLSRWKVPAAQPPHLSLPASAALPASHALGTVVPVAQNEPAGHTAQSTCDAPPVAPRHDPALHGVTDLAPTPHQPPASHVLHAVAPAAA